jgi:hypothetical protein
MSIRRYAKPHRSYGLPFICALLLLSAQQAAAADAVLVVVANNTGLPASDLHLNFNGGGGVLYADPQAVFAGTCPVPNVPTNPPVVSNTVVVDWGVNCVQPAFFVAVLVTTPNGPLAYTSGFWTSNGTNIGAIAPADISWQHVTLPGGSVPVGQKIQVRYRPNGRGVYTPWMKGPKKCWTRRCCFPNGFICEFRIIRCPFSNPFNRFWETGPWTALTGWRSAGNTGPIWFRQRLTYPPPPNFPGIFGTFANMPEAAPEFERPWYRTLKVLYSDDGGVTFRPATDFTSTFLDISGALAYEVTEASEPIEFDELIAYYAPKFQKAADLLSPLIAEAQVVLDSSELTAAQFLVMQNIIADVSLLQSGFVGVSEQFAAGTPTSPEPFQQVSQALNQLAQHIQQVGLSRFAHSAANLQSMAEGFDVSASMIEAGLDKVDNQDFFLWGIMNRFQPMLAQFASSTISHVRVKVGMGDYQWFRSAGPGVEYQVLDARGLALLDSGVAPISDLDAIDVQTYHDGTATYWLRFKAPTHLSKVVRFRSVDGATLNAGQLIGGDVNGDNCVDQGDLDQVLADLGSGGELAEFVPPSDANFDGEVTDVDVDIVIKNMGRCGQEIPASAGGERDLVLTWNEAGLEAIRKARSAPPIAARTLGMVHLAMFEAINAVEQRFESYFEQGFEAPPGLRPELAGTAAAHAVLSALYPDFVEQFDAVLTESLTTVEDTGDTDASLEFGRTVADAVLAARTDDGASASAAYAPSSGPGAWTPTPPNSAPALLPQWPGVKPFCMADISGARRPGPPALQSAEYLTAFNEVKSLGAKQSTVRTAEQTEIALFWVDGPGTATPAGHWFQIARDISMQQGTSLEDNARLFALLGMAVCDAGICAWDNKYAYNHWRPITAIRAADNDMNPETVADPNWESLIPTPPFPAYISGHSTFSGAASKILAQFYGTDVLPFLTTSDDVPGQSRSYDRLSQAANEAGRSRIYGGIHWEYDNQDGLASGRELATYIYSNFLRERDTSEVEAPTEDVSRCGAMGFFPLGVIALALVSRRRFARMK